VAQKWPGNWSFVARGKVPILKQALRFLWVLSIFHGWPASCPIRRDRHMQLWSVGQSGWVHLARQCCVVAHPWPAWLRNGETRLVKPLTSRCQLVWTPDELNQPMHKIKRRIAQKNIHGLLLIHSLPCCVTKYGVLSETAEGISRLTLIFERYFALLLPRQWKSQLRTSTK